MKTYSFPQARMNLAEIEKAAKARAEKTDVNYGEPPLTGVDAETPKAPKAKETGETQEKKGQEKTGGKKKKA